jgi:HlyD family secretion protein
VRRVLVGGTALAVVAGGGYAAWAQASEPAAAYRTAKVTREDVEQRLELTGVLASSGTQELSFGTSGTVATVDVSVGQRVTKGQLLGTLDRTSLRSTAQRARADLAAARAQLEEDEETQEEQVETAADDSGSSSSSSSSQPAADPSFEPGQDDSDQQSGGPDPLDQLHQQQDAVTSAQTTASGALSAAQDALTHQTEMCTAAPGGQACADALAAVQAAQQQVATAQTALQEAIEVLSRTLAQAVAALEQQQSEGQQQPQDQPSEQPTTQQPQVEQPSASEESTGPTITAATLARDQADIEQARADLVAADQALAGAVVRAPRAGRVVAVAAEAGGSASAGGTAFTVVAPGTTTVTLAATATQLRSLEVGQSATVTPVGAERGRGAEVTYVDPVPDTSSDTTTYAVTVTLGRARLSLPNGAPATVSVVVGQATGALTVPTSAVSNGTVQVLKSSEVTVRPVTTGIVGTTRTEITDGLSLGDEVVVADLNEELPSSDTGESNGFREGNGGFGGNGPVVGPGPGPVVQR